MYRTQGRAPRGEKIYASIAGKKSERISMIGGWFRKNFIAPMTFRGGCDKEVFNTWLAQVLLPELSPGTTVVMDNAAFHKSARTKELIQEAHCHLLFLPTYSPDLNPIEHCWHTIKSKMRSGLGPCKDLQTLVGNTIIEVYQYN